MTLKAMTLCLILLVVGMFVSCDSGTGGALPTTSPLWRIDFGDAGPDLDRVALLMELDTLAEGYGIPLEFWDDVGDTSVLIHAEGGPTGTLGRCGPGEDCEVWLRSGNVLLQSERLIALIVFHEILHSYGLSHHEAEGNLMNAEFNLFRWPVELESWQIDTVNRLINLPPAE